MCTKLLSNDQINYKAFNNNFEGKKYKKIPGKFLLALTCASYVPYDFQLFPTRSLWKFGWFFFSEFLKSFDIRVTHSVQNAHVYHYLLYRTYAYGRCLYYVREHMHNNII